MSIEASIERIEREKKEGRAIERVGGSKCQVCMKKLERADLTDVLTSPQMLLALDIPVGIERAMLWW